MPNKQTAATPLTAGDPFCNAAALLVFYRTKFSLWEKTVVSACYEMKCFVALVQFCRRHQPLRVAEENFVRSFGECREMCVPLPVLYSGGLGYNTY